MPEGIAAPEIEKENREFKAGKTGGEAAEPEEPAKVRREGDGAAEERAPEKAPAEKAPPKAKASFLKEFMLSKRIEEEIRREAQPKGPLEARFIGGDVAQIPPELAGTENPVALRFRERPPEGTLLYLEKQKVRILEGPESKLGTTGFGKFFRAELPRNPKGEVPKWVNPKDIYLRPVPVPEEEVRARMKESVDMRDYLTNYTLEALKIPRAENPPEVQELRQAA